MVALTIDRLQQYLSQPVPRRDDLQHRFLGDHVPFAVERDTLVDDDPDIDGACAAFVQCFK
jgi:hypothetical protein